MEDIYFLYESTMMNLIYYRMQIGDL